MTGDHEDQPGDLDGPPVRQPRTDPLAWEVLQGRWRDRAACLGLDSDDWFPIGDRGSAGRADAARRICAACPVRRSCLGLAIVTAAEFGIFGGLDPAARAPLVRAWWDGAALTDVLDAAAGRRDGGRAA